MANTTFNGPVRSENGFQQITKNGTTGAVTQKQFEVQTVATSGINNIVDTNGFSGTATAAGANNASLDTGATIFGITPNTHGSGIPDASINTFVNKMGGTIEVPTGGDPDINVDISATGTTASGAAVASGTQMMNNGDLTLGYYNSVDAGAVMAALSKKYIYLVQGDATNAAYTAGKIWIRITGMNVDYANG